MPVLAEHEIHAIYAVALAIFLLTGALIVYALIRRKAHRSYFDRLDNLRIASRPLLDGLVAGAIPYESGLNQLKALRDSSRDGMFERVLIEARLAASQTAALTRISNDLGFIRAWQEALAAPARRKAKANRAKTGWQNWPSPDFPNRAKAAQFLGLLNHRPSWRLLVLAVSDRNADVRTTAARALGAIAEPRSFPVLLRELKDAVTSEHPRISVATLRLALAGYPLHLVPAAAGLLHDSDPRIRFLGAEVIQEMLAHAAAAADSLQLAGGDFPIPFLNALLADFSHDPSPDVRARMAIIFGYVADCQVRDALARLLADSEWFVRLQAVKSIGRGGTAGIEAQVAARLSDSDWRVREAAAHVVAQQSGPGADLLLTQFLETRDPYTKEQIAEEAERSGIVRRWLSALGEAGHERETQAIAGLVDMGKTAFLRDFLNNGGSKLQKAKLAAQLGLQGAPAQKGQAAGR